MNVFVDTSVWSLALRRHGAGGPEVARLADALGLGEQVFTTGLVLQELLQGARGPRSKSAIVGRFALLPFLVPDRTDHVAAADLRNACRRKGIRVGTIDALLAELCLRHDLTMLSADDDFRRIARVRPLRVWKA